MNGPSGPVNGFQYCSSTGPQGTGGDFLTALSGRLCDDRFLDCGVAGWFDDAFGLISRVFGAVASPTTGYQRQCQQDTHKQ